jgi:protein-S-isoprenylcysteine O-methyltransferase Ste14
MVIWVIDSFFLHLTTITRYLPWFIRIPVSLILGVLGLYLIDQSHKLVLDDEPVFIDWGVFRYVRHPMYLGILLIYLALVVSTLSVASLAFWSITILAYDIFADFEEEKLHEILGEEYLEYKKKTRRWIPF